MVSRNIVAEACMLSFIARCLGYRPVGADGKPGEYKFHTYSEVKGVLPHLESVCAQCRRVVRMRHAWDGPSAKGA